MKITLEIDTKDKFDLEFLNALAYKFTGVRVDGDSS
jgi:hypothetical protein